MTFIIAEVGSNWTSFEDAKDSITMAKNCGADAVKFQLYTHKELYGFDGKLSGEMPREWIPLLAEKAKACGIEFMCTAFSPEGLEFIDPYVVRHKIASAELTYRELLIAAAKTGKPIILSTGASSLKDIEMSLPGFYRSVSLTLMYCVSNYPAKNVNLECIVKLREAMREPVGYSCHTDDWITPYYAVKHYGATVIEKHFKLKPMLTPDAAHALDPSEFKKMVDAIRSLKTVCHFPDPQEADMLLRHNRRNIAIAEIKAGDLLEQGVNYGCFRVKQDDPLGCHGLIDLNGKAAKEDIAAFQPIELAKVQ